MKCYLQQDIYCLYPVSRFKMVSSLYKRIDHDYLFKYQSADNMVYDFITRCAMVIQFNDGASMTD